jgi:predicted transposase/invertase (TIGR01784 family)
MSKPVATAHDSFFKRVLSEPALAAAFLRDHLSPDIAGLLGPEPPETVPGSFIDEELRQHHSDLLFRIQLRTGADAFAYVLMEHKSSPDPGARLQLLRYVVRILTNWYDQNQQQLPLPPVLPLLVHQGPEGWKLSCEFLDLFGPVAEPLRPYLPSFCHELVDLTRVDDSDLSTQVRLRAFLKALKYSRRTDLPDCIDIVLAEAPELGEQDLYVIMTYLDKGPIPLDKNLMHDTLQRLVPDRKEQIMGWFSQPYYDQGMADGKAAGKVEGRVEGEAKILVRLLERRFGALPAALRQRIVTSSAESIEAWVERAFDAADLQSIFDSN